MTIASVVGGQVDVGLGDAADVGADDVDRDLLLRQLGDLVLERLQRAGHVGLEQQVELTAGGGAGLRVEDVLERDAAALAAGQGLGLQALAALVGELARLAVVLDDAHVLAGVGHGVEAEHLDGLGRRRPR